jgi:hypothetical protein
MPYRHRTSHPEGKPGKEKMKEYDREVKQKEISEPKKRCGVR